jgi:hypothetical protein
VQQRGLSDASLSGDNASCSSTAHRRDEAIQQLTCRLTPHEKVISDIADEVSRRNLSHPAITPPASVVTYFSMFRWVQMRQALSPTESGFT